MHCGWVYIWDTIPEMVELDSIDHAILRALQKDASLSMDALSEAVHLSRNAAWRRVKALEAAGVIRGRVALLDAEKLGCGLHVLVMIRTAQHDPDWLAQFGRAVRALPQIVSAYRMTGDLDYVLRVRLRDMAAYDAFYKDLTSRVPVSDISASFVMESIKDTTELPV